MKNCTPSWREADLEMKMLKDRRFKPLEVEMFKRRTPLWRETHFQVNMLKARWVLRILDSWRWRCLKIAVSSHFWKLRCWKSASRCRAKHVQDHSRNFNEPGRCGETGSLELVSVSDVARTFWLKLGHDTIIKRLASASGPALQRTDSGYIVGGTVMGDTITLVTILRFTYVHFAFRT